MTQLFRAAVLVDTLSLAGCGAVYIAPQVTAADANVRIVPLTADSVAAANMTPYVPRALPAAFFASAGAGGVPRGAGGLPEPSLADRPRAAAQMLVPPPPVDPGPYRIGPGDVLLIATRNTGTSVAELSGLLAAQNRRQGYTVQDDGAIAIPDVGRVPVSGLTLEEAEARLFQTLVDNRLDPSFSLEVAEFNAAQVTVGGAVAQAAVVPVGLTPLRLDAALTTAGGLTPRDLDYATIRIYRDGALYQIPVQAYLRRPDLQKTRLIGGDSVFVDTSYALDQAQAYFSEQIALQTLRSSARSQAISELNSAVALRRAELAEQRANFTTRLDLGAEPRDHVFLTGEVLKRGRVALPFGRSASLADTLLGEGGFSTEKANPAQIYVLRGATDPRDAGAVTAWHLDARNPANLVLATRFQMRPNDIIFVEEQPITKWNRAIQQIVPSLITTTAAQVTN